MRLTSVSLLSSSLPMSARSVWSCRDSALGLWSASLEPRDTALTSSPMPASRGLTNPPVPFGCCVGSGVADPPASLSSSLDPPPFGARSPGIDGSFYRVFLGLVIIASALLNENIRKRIMGTL